MIGGCQFHRDSRFEIIGERIYKIRKIPDATPLHDLAVRHIKSNTLCRGIRRFDHRCVKQFRVSVVIGNKARQHYLIACRHAGCCTCSGCKTGPIIHNNGGSAGDRVDAVMRLFEAGKLKTHDDATLLIVTAAGLEAS